MGKLAFVFPGQGAQVIGMGKDFFDHYEVAKKLFAEADEVLGYSIKKICFEGSEEILKLTENTQPAILTVSVIAQKILAEHGIEPTIVAGHSLGEYSALVAADVMNFSDAVHVVHVRGKLMQEAVPVGEGAMAAIMGLSRDEIRKICQDITSQDEATDLVQAVNLNCPGQTVIAGRVRGVEKAVQALTEAGAIKCVVLPVSAPFHSALMKPAAEKLAKELEKIEIRDAKFPVVANFTGKIESSAEDIKRNLFLQADHPVLWEDCVATMRDFGATTFIEPGIGKTLCQFNKRIDKSLKSFPVENLATLEKALRKLSE